MLFRLNFPICNLFGLKMQVIISYLGCIYKRKEPDGKERTGVPGGFMTELPNMVGLSPSDLVFKWVWGLVMAAREKRINGSKDSFYKALRRCRQLVALDGLGKTYSLLLNHLESSEIVPMPGPYPQRFQLCDLRWD